MKWLLGMMVVVITAGCANTRYERAARTGELLRAARADVVAARQQIVDTMALLDALLVAPPSELRPRYRKLRREIKGVEKASARAADRTNRYRSYADAHVRAWAAELESLEDEKLREVSQRHRAEAKEHFAGIEKNALAVRQAYWPLLEQLRGIRQHLEHDLTEAGIDAIRPKVTEAQRDAEALQQCIDVSLAELARVADLLDPPAP
jgi:DNA repair exonuclease SbcCD ATPase subunit